MPRIGESNLDQFIRMFVVGPSKSFKTWFAGTAAEAGFRVHILDGDDGSHILNKIKPEAQPRIDVLQCRDTHDFSPFINLMFLLAKQENRIVWDTSRNRMLSKSEIRTLTDGERYVIDPSKFTEQDVLIVDTWTSLVESLVAQLIREQEIDLETFDPEKLQVFRPIYNKGGQILNHILSRMKTWRCHVVIIGHEIENEIREIQMDGSGRRVEVVKERLTTASSLTKNHSSLLAKYFSDIPVFKSQGKSARIELGGSPTRIGGCRAFPPGIRIFDPYEEIGKRFDFGKFAEAYGFVGEFPPTAQAPGFLLVREGEEINAAMAATIPDLGGVTTQGATEMAQAAQIINETPVSIKAVDSVASAAARLAALRKGASTR